MTTQSCIADCAVAHPAIRLCFPPPLQALRLHNMSFAGVAPWCRPWLRAAEQRCGAMGYAGADVKEAVALDSVRDRFTTTAALLELFGRPERPPPPYPVPLPPFGCPLMLPPPPLAVRCQPSITPSCRRPPPLSSATSSSAPCRSTPRSPPWSSTSTPPTCSHCCRRWRQTEEHAFSPHFAISPVPPLSIGCAALASVTTPGAGQAVTYYVGPQADGRVELSSGKPSVAEVRAGWHPDPVSLRYRRRGSHVHGRGDSGCYSFLGRGPRVPGGSPPPPVKLCACPCLCVLKAEASPPGESAVVSARAWGFTPPPLPPICRVCLPLTMPHEGRGGPHGEPGVRRPLDVVSARARGHHGESVLRARSRVPRGGPTAPHREGR